VPPFLLLKRIGFGLKKKKVLFYLGLPVAAYFVLASVIKAAIFIYFAYVKDCDHCFNSDYKNVEIASGQLGNTEAVDIGYGYFVHYPVGVYSLKRTDFNDETFSIVLTHDEGNYAVSFFVTDYSEDINEPISQAVQSKTNKNWFYSMFYDFQNNSISVANMMVYSRLVGAKDLLIAWSPSQIYKVWFEFFSRANSYPIKDDWCESEMYLVEYSGMRGTFCGLSGKFHTSSGDLYLPKEDNIVVSIAVLNIRNSGINPYDVLTQIYIDRNL
jgi:hypothetical protein